MRRVYHERNTNCGNIISIEFYGSNTINSMTNFCRNCFNLTNVFIDSSKFTSNNVCHMLSTNAFHNAFKDCTSLVNIAVVEFYSDIEYMDNSFRNCTSLTGQIDMSGISQMNQSSGFKNVFNGTSLSKSVYFGWDAGYTIGYNIKNVVKLINDKNGVTTYVS